VRALPHSAWSAPPHFSNADEQAQLNDVLASSLSGAVTHSAGVEFYEARFKKQFASRHCFPDQKGRSSLASASEECVSAREAARLMGDSFWQHRMQTGGVSPARAALRSERLPRGAWPAAHLCRRSEWDGAQAGTLRVPGNASAPSASVYLAPQGLFSHFPYGSFFPAARHCRAASWEWEKRSPLERRLCAPQHRVPSHLLHMAGLRQEQWGRRSLLRSLGAWLPQADAVAPHAWVSARAHEAAAAATAEERRAAWGRGAAGRLLVTQGVRTSFASMGEFDRFAARLLLLGLLTRRRVVVPAIPCHLSWMQRALEPRHLRGMDVGCGEQRQCVWLPYPHHVDPWCSGIDFLNDFDFRDMVESKAVATVGPHVSRLRLASLQLSRNQTGPLVTDCGGGSLPQSPQLLVLEASPEAGTPADPPADPLGWLPLGGFRSTDWTGRLPRRVDEALRAPPPVGMGASDAQMKIVRDCLRSLSTSKE
jgi:hypothetical protein